DHADLAGAIDIAPALGDFTGVVGVGRLQREFGRDALDDLARGHDRAHLPAVGAAHVHELDEAHDVAAAAKVARHVDHAVVVLAALDHHVDLDRSKADGRRRVNAFEY